MIFKSNIVVYVKIYSGDTGVKKYLPIKLCNAFIDFNFNAFMLFQEPPLSQKEGNEIVILI